MLAITQTSTKSSLSANPVSNKCLVARNMKLQILREGDLLRALARGAGISYGRKSSLNLSTLDVKPENGQDFGSRAAGATFLPSGMPRKPKHRRFLGMGRQFSLTPPGF